MHLSLSFSLFVSFEMWRIFGACLVATGQRKRACWYAHRYPVPSWNLSVKLFRASRVSDLPLWIRNVVFFHARIYIYTRMFTDSIVKEEEKERGEKKKSIRQRRERENNGVNEPWTTSTRNSRNGRSTAVFGIPLRIWRVQKYQGHFCSRRNESEAYVNLYAYVLSMRKLNRVNQGREELESIEFLEFDFV